MRRPPNQFYSEFDRETLGRRENTDHRSPFQVDRDRIVFSGAFRRLQAKTQVFRPGEYDFYRNRLTHSVEVARIARSLCERLNAHRDEFTVEFHIDPDLVEAVGLAHDLGHPPFGHIGERKLNRLMEMQGGFEGNAQTLRILTDTIYDQRDGRTGGLAPTRALLDGVLKYKDLRRELTAAKGAPPSHHFLYDSQDSVRAFVFGLEQGQTPPEPVAKVRSIECQIMDWADDAAYCLHDLVDGARARFITAEKLNRWELRQEGLDALEADALEKLRKTLEGGNLDAFAGRKTGMFVEAARLVPQKNFLSAKTHRHAWGLAIDERVQAEAKLYKRLATELIFRAPAIQQAEFKGGRILEELFNTLADHAFRRVHQPLCLLPEEAASRLALAANEADRWRILCDHLTALTDAEAVRVYRRLFDPDHGGLGDLV